MYAINFLVLSETRSLYGNLAPVDLIPGVAREFISDPSTVGSASFNFLCEMEIPTVPFYDNQEGTIRNSHQLIPSLV